MAGYLDEISRAGFQRIEWHEHPGDEPLVEALPSTGRYLGRPILLLIRAEHPA